MQFIGDNDKSTLLGAAEELDHEIKIYDHRARTERLKRDQYASAKVAGVLRSLAYTFRMAAEHGPAPDLSKLSEMRLTLTPESRVALAAARGIDLGPQLTADRTADDIANDLLSKVKLDNEELLLPNVTRCKNCDEIIEEDDGYRHDPSGKGYVHKYCPEDVDTALGIDSSSDADGMNAVDPEVSCTFCGFDLDADGGCSNAIDELCTISPKAIPPLEKAVQEYGMRAAIVVAVTEAKESWHILFDGMLIGSRRTRVGALTSALERLSMRLQGKLHGSPDVTFGACVDGCVAEGKMGPKVVYFNGDGWQCAEHRDA